MCNPVSKRDPAKRKTPQESDSEYVPASGVHMLDSDESDSSGDSLRRRERGSPSVKRKIRNYFNYLLYNFYVKVVGRIIQSVVFLLTVREVFSIMGASKKSVSFVQSIHDFLFLHGIAMWFEALTLVTFSTRIHNALLALNPNHKSENSILASASCDLQIYVFIYVMVSNFSNFTKDRWYSPEVEGSAGNLLNYMSYARIIVSIMRLGGPMLHSTFTKDLEEKGLLFFPSTKLDSIIVKMLLSEPICRFAYWVITKSDTAFSFALSATFWYYVTTSIFQKHFQYSAKEGQKKSMTKVNNILPSTVPF